ncbi:MAG: SocA family protein [Flavipsychrobacter sp.]|nr:SocA family protein [Flavipsychrobacter sp.]
MLKSLGGSAPVRYLFALCYHADQEHLARYGCPITGDRYLAARNGALPMELHTYYQEFRKSRSWKKSPVLFAEYFRAEETGILHAVAEYNEQLISPTEAACLFEIIHGQKNRDPELFIATTRDTAWEMADEENFISLQEMARAAAATDEMLRYIDNSIHNEMAILHEHHTPRP